MFRAGQKIPDMEQNRIMMSGTVTDRYIQTYPLARQMEFNSKLLKLGEQTDLMEELQGLTTDQIKALIEMVKNNKS